VGPWSLLTIEPPSFILFNSALRQLKMPLALTSVPEPKQAHHCNSLGNLPMIKFQSSSVSEARGTGFRSTPAMLAAPSSLPSFSTVVWIHELTLELSRTSTTEMICLSPERDLRAASNPWRFVSAMDRIAPRLANSLDVARPMPLAPPVRAI